MGSIFKKSKIIETESRKWLLVRLLKGYKLSAIV